MDVTTKNVEFLGALGYKIAAKIEMPRVDPVAYALFAPCFTCGKDIVAAKRVCRRLAARHIAVMRIDFTGIGGSGGDFSETTFTTNVADIILAAEFLAKEYRPPEILIGHSLGGTATLAAAGKIENSRCVVTIGAPFNPAHVIEHFKDEIPRIKAEKVAEIQIMGRPFRVSYNFIEDIMKQPQADRISALHKSLLVMHSPIDTFVGIENAEKIFIHAQHPRSYISLDNADHLLMKNAEDAAYVADIIAHWAEYYICVGVQKLA